MLHCPFQYHYHTLLLFVFLFSLSFSQDHTSRTSMAKDDEFYDYYASSTSSSSLIRSISQKPSTTNFKSPLLRTFSHKNSSSSYNSPLPPLPPLSRDCLQKSSSSSSSSRQRVSSRISSSSSMKCSEIAHKCTRLVKEQRARFYIMKRCVKMLVCWGKHDRS